MHYARLTALIVLTGSLVACSDTATSPRPGAGLDDDRTFVHGGGASQALTPTDKYHFQMTIDPKHNTVWDLGAGNSLSFPRGSLCDVSKSTYGAGEWDKPCTASKSAVTLDVTVWVDAAGHPRVNFEPSVRFVPSADPRDWVVLTFADLQASLDPFYNINYCPTATSSCHNEALKDPSLATLRDPKTGKITRRIKHFSGYNVAAGEDRSMESLRVGGHVMALPGLGASLSISTADLRFRSVTSLQAAYPGMDAGDASAMFARIESTRKLSGYILASGHDEE